MGRIGMEWAFRLAHDPKRLFARYCIEPWSLVGALVADLFGRAWEAMRSQGGRSRPLRAWNCRPPSPRRGEWRTRRPVAPGMAPAMAPAPVMDRRLELTR